jgi:hypothetical protein
MHELGNVQYAAQGTRALTPPRNESPNPSQKKATIKIADDDAAAVVIRNPWHIQDIQQDNEYTDALFSARRPIGTKANPSNSESSRFVIYSEPSKLRLKLAEEIKAIDAFDGFQLGVHDNIEKFPKNSEFVLNQILDVEKRMAKVHETLELYKFTLKRVRAEAFKALRCQGNLGPQRVLLLLKDNIAKLNNALQVKDKQTDANLE